jgi:hypothetical protein
VEHHYVCFVKSATGDLGVLDGELDGPVKECTLAGEEDIWDRPGLEVTQVSAKGWNLRFTGSR